MGGLSSQRRMMTIDGLQSVSMMHAGRGAAEEALHLTATTTGAAQTVTINRIKPVGSNITIDWGDGGAPTVVIIGDAAAKSHVYALADTYTITATPSTAVQQLDIHQYYLSGFHSAELAGSTLTYFRCYNLGPTVPSVIDSADMIGWTPATWQLYLMGAGGTYTIDSADMIGWTPTTWQLYLMGAGGTYTIDSADMAGWTPTDWWLRDLPAGTYTIDSADLTGWTPTYWRMNDMPAGTYTITSADLTGWTPTYWWLYSITGGGAAWTLTAADFAGWTTTANCRCDDNALTQAQVNAVLYGMYQASVAPRTASGGTINVGGTNAAPSGTFQAAAACPVDAATPGKEVAHELLNDGCAEGFNVWATVTFTA